jgi:hypothetical protein
MVPAHGYNTMPAVLQVNSLCSVAVCTQTSADFINLQRVKSILGSILVVTTRTDVKWKATKLKTQT